jgi:hypothetical protein
MKKIAQLIILISMVPFALLLDLIKLVSGLIVGFVIIVVAALSKSLDMFIKKV